MPAKMDCFFIKAEVVHAVDICLCGQLQSGQKMLVTVLCSWKEWQLQGFLRFGLSHLKWSCEAEPTCHYHACTLCHDT